MKYSFRWIHCFDPENAENSNSTRVRFKSNIIVIFYLTPMQFRNTFMFFFLLRLFHVKSDYCGNKHIQKAIFMYNSEAKHLFRALRIWKPYTREKKMVSTFQLNKDVIACLCATLSIAMHFRLHSLPMVANFNYDEWIGFVCFVLVWFVCAMYNAAVVVVCLVLYFNLCEPERATKHRFFPCVRVFCLTPIALFAHFM